MDPSANTGYFVAMPATGIPLQNCWAEKVRRSFL
jgi:hypothetical protein